MWRYLKAAFLVGVDVQGLGRVPVNLLGVAAVAIFGVVEPSLWLAGLGLETALVASLAFSPRFQRLTDGAESLKALAEQALEAFEQAQHPGGSIGAGQNAAPPTGFPGQQQQGTPQTIPATLVRRNS